MQGVLVFFLVLFLILILTSWVMSQPLRRNEAMRQMAHGGAGPVTPRDYTGVERRVRADRRRGERRRTEIDASLGHA